jgi:Dolichyl-phosphate-mannose-protein mannosyltransferase
MRLPSVALSLLAIALVHRTCAAVAGERGRHAGLYAAALLALFPTQIFWGAQVRMHALGLALVALASLLLARALAARDRRAWARYGLVAALAIYAHYFVVFTIAAHAAIAVTIALRERRLPRASAWAPAVLLAAWLPWIGTVLRQRAHVHASWWAAPLDVYGASSMWYGCWVPRWWAWQPKDAPGVATVASVSCVTILGLALLAWRGRAAARAIVATIVLPFGLGALASLGGARVMNGPYLVFVQLSVAAAVGLALSGERWRPRAALGAVALAALAVHATSFPARIAQHAPDYAELLHRLEALRADAAEPVVVDAFDYFTLLYYAPDRRGWHVYGSDAGRVLHFNGGALVTEDDRALDDDGVRELAARGRLWIVQNLSASGSRTVPAPPGARPLRAAGLHATRLTEYAPSSL